MKNIDTIFAPLIGQILWSVKKGHGSWFSVEFGPPHLQVREPIKSKGNLARVTEHLARRQIFVHGQWNFLVMHASWDVSVLGKSCNDYDKPSKISKILDILNGQKLTRVSYDLKKHSLTLECDLGGVVQLWKSIEEDDYDLWGLTNFATGSMLVYENDGTISEHSTSSCKAGSISIIDYRKDASKA